MTDVLQDIANKVAIASLGENLTNLPLCEWITAIDSAREDSKIANAESVQKCLDELAEQAPGNKFAKSLMDAENDCYSSIFEVVDSKPNYRQFSIA
jgi:hypothetical protein